MGAEEIGIQTCLGIVRDLKKGEILEPSTGILERNQNQDRKNPIKHVLTVYLAAEGLLVRRNGSLLRLSLYIYLLGTF